jgi:hypothetical protein
MSKDQELEYLTDLPRYEKPWLKEWKREVNWDSIIFYSGVVIALGQFAVTL